MKCFTVFGSPVVPEALTFGICVADLCCRGNCNFQFPKMSKKFDKQKIMLKKSLVIIPSNTSFFSTYSRKKHFILAFQAKNRQAFPNTLLVIKYLDLVTPLNYAKQYVLIVLCEKIFKANGIE